MTKTAWKGYCYGCFTDVTYQLFGMTHRYGEEIQRYVDGINEERVVKCYSCDRTVRYVRDAEKWREVVVD